MRPEKSTYPTYYENYIPLVNEENILEALSKDLFKTKNMLLEIPFEKENFAYAENKWTVKEVVNHIIDTERIFAYRALRFARKDSRVNLSFEQDDYVKNAELANRSLKDLVDEFESVRNATISLFKSFTINTLLLKGEVAAGPVTVLALGFALCGHNIHHLNVIKEKYLN
jgi:hypothetical protein